MMFSVSRKQRASMAQDGAAEEQMHAGKYPAHMGDPNMFPVATWDRGGDGGGTKYVMTDTEPYPLHTSSVLTDRDSGYPGSTTTYRPPTDDSAFYEPDVTTVQTTRPHIYESPQFS